MNLNSRKGLKIAALISGVLALHFLLPLSAVAQNGPPSGNPPGQGAPPPGQGGAPPGQGVPATATVQVDCADGDSINAALETPAEELTIEISAICTESVVIGRDRVTVIGTDPVSDGIRGPSTADPASSRAAAILIDGAASVRIENLSIADSVRFGLLTRNAGFVDIVNCDIFDNARDGVQVSADSTVFMKDVTLRDNVRGGVATFGGDLFVCDTCTVTGNRWGVLAVNSSRGDIRNSTFSDNVFGVGAFSFSTIALADSTNSASSISLFAQEFSHIDVIRGSLTNPVFALDKSLLTLAEVGQGNPRGFNIIRLDSTVRLDAATLSGYHEVADFSKMLVLNSSVIDGDLDCGTGGDAVCADPMMDIAGTSNCGMCSKP